MEPFPGNGFREDIVNRKNGYRMGDSTLQWQPIRKQDVPPQIMETVQAVVDKLPDLPLSVNKIIEMASDDNTDMSELVELVSSDPTLVSNILRVVNSSYYGLSHKTDNLHLAIVLLGFAEVRKIALKNYVSQTVGGKEIKGYDTKELWEHSYLVSTCAEIFSPEDDQQLRGTLMTLGLLHDVSKFALYPLAVMLKEKGIRPKRTSELSESSYLLEKEEALFEVNHAIVGSLLAKKWKLSDRFISVLEYHHYPSFFDRGEIPDEYIHEITAISLADYLVHVYTDTANILPMPMPEFFNIAGVKPSPEDILTSETVAKLDKAKIFMGSAE